jgi:hypothetical protein
MRRALLVLAVWTMPLACGTTHAQRVLIIPAHGVADKVIDFGALPADLHAVVRQQLGCVPRVAFIYRHFFIFRPGFDLWRWSGRFVLYHEGECWDLPREELDALLGLDGTARLSTPWEYYLSPGLATILGLVALVVFFERRTRSAAKRFSRLLQDEHYVAALGAYAEALPKGAAPTPEQRRAGIEAGVARLVLAGVRERRAHKDLRMLIGTVEVQRSNELRDQAYDLAMDGAWEEAAAYYQEAAEYAADWNPKAAQFARGRVDWCQREALRARRREPDGADMDSSEADESE